MPPTGSLTRLRTEFFNYLFGQEVDGYLCICTSSRSDGVFRQKFFKWPETNATEKVNHYIASRADKHDVWFCTSLLDSPERTKEHCIAGSLIWADLDYIPVVDQIEPPPSCLVESSPGRYQAFWRLTSSVPPDVQEDFARRVEFLNRPDGAHGGWDLTQLLRVPYTYNLKYPAPYPQVSIVYARDTLVPVEVFDELADVVIDAPTDNGSVEMPDVDTLPDIKSVIYSHRHALSEADGFNVLVGQEPSGDADWSKLLWRLINICVEAGLSNEETLVVAMSAKCNKYERDNRPLSFLWREVLKASINHSSVAILSHVPTKLEMPDLIDPDKITEDSLVKDYKEWGEIATDAPPQYHELSSFIALSALLSNGVSLKASFGTLHPNLWGMILGESTLTRKTTAMRMAMDIVAELDEEAILATDGSPEGLLTGLSARPERVSIFYKDEVSGFFDSVNRKDYLAGLPETLTQLYDVPKILQRLLRKETITIHEPYFIFFGGGIRDKVYSLITENYVLSGFLPRFLIVSADNDMDRWRPTGPPTETTETAKNKVVNTLVELKERYGTKAAIEVAGQTMLLPVKYDAKMSDKVWEYYGKLERKLVDSGTESPLQMVALPTFQRMAFSMLKMAVLIAATRREPNKANFLEVTKGDIDQAAFYIQKWGHYAVDLISNAGRSDSEKILDKIVKFVATNQGCSKSTIMNNYRLTAKEARDVLDTLTERGMIIVRRSGKTTKLFTVV